MFCLQFKSQTKSIYPQSMKKALMKQPVAKPSTKRKNYPANRQKRLDNQKMNLHKQQRHLQAQLDSMFAQMNHILTSMNHVTKQRIFHDILKEHLLEAKRNMLYLIRGEKIIDQKSQQLSKRQELNYYQTRLRYFSKFKEWVKQIDSMKKLDVQNWDQYSKSTQFPQLFLFILKELEVEDFLNASLTINEAMDLYIKYIYTFKDQQKQLIYIHFTKIKIFLMQFQALSKFHVSPHDQMAMFAYVNYSGEGIKTLLVEPKVYQVCEQYIKWKMYLCSR